MTPCDLFEDRAEIARVYEVTQLGIKPNKLAATAEAGSREKARRKAKATGLPPLFVD